MILSREDAERIVAQAEQHGGKCEHCHSNIKIYRYKINKTQVQLLKSLAALAIESGHNVADIRKLPSTNVYTIRSQVTKLRLHGLVAHHREDGHRVAAMWVITRKGYAFLNGRGIDETVVSFQNTTIGHEGRIVTIGDVSGEAGDQFGKTNLTTTEANVYGDARATKIGKRYDAVYAGNMPSLTRGEEYIITVPHMTVGKPVTVNIAGTNGHYSYRDIAQFQNNWKIVRQHDELLDDAFLDQ